MSATSGQLESRPYQPPSVQERAAAVFRSVPSEEDLKALVKNSATIITITNQAGYDQCHSARMALKNTRLEIERTGEEGRDDAVQTSKAIIAIQKSRISITKAEEDRLAAIQKAWDDRIAREKEEKIQAEIARVESIQRRIEEIRSMPVHGAGLDSLMLGQMLSKAESIVIDSAVFQEFTEKADQALDVTCAALVGLLAKRKEHEAEQERVKAEREELAKLRAEAAERDRIAREAQAKADAEAKAERERLEEIARQERLAEARAHAQKIAADRAENERLAAIRQKELDEQKAANDKLAEEQRQAAAAEAGKIAADRAKLEADQAAARKAAEPEVLSKSQAKRLSALGVPSQQAIIECIAGHFKTDIDTARGWLVVYGWKNEQRKSA